MGGRSECTDEVNEWVELAGLLSAYDPNAEVIIGLFDEGAEFFRLPLLTDRGRSQS